MLLLYSRPTATSTNIAPTRQHCFDGDMGFPTRPPACTAADADELPNIRLARVGSVLPEVAFCQSRTVLLPKQSPCRNNRPPRDCQPELQLGRRLSAEDDQQTPATLQHGPLSLGFDPPTDL